ncbi:hypothetical protein Vadar_023539 [Vaccinium darrowii]|nr:hypothetical protein Vadar_023539 [Vaccinium darrowii]
MGSSQEPFGCQRSNARHLKLRKSLEALRRIGDHVLEEMVWLSKDFESEKKWKLAQVKKVTIRASKGMLDPEKKVKGEEQRMRKVALNISKDVKKFWLKIEKVMLEDHWL